MKSTAGIGSVGVSGTSLKAIVQPWDWVLCNINLLYIDKIKKDIDDYKMGKPLMGLRQFTVQWFLVRFGYPKIAEAVLSDFLRSLIEYEPEHERFRTFLNLCGIHVERGAVKAARDRKRQLMWEKQMESPEVLMMFLKLIHCLRYMQVPFMPNISNEDRKRVDEGNVINYGKAKGVFIGLMTEEGYSKEDFKEFDVPCK